MKVPFLIKGEGERKAVVAVRVLLEFSTADWLLGQLRRIRFGFWLIPVAFD